VVMTTLGEDLIILGVGLKPRLGPNTGVLSLTVQRALRGTELVDLAIAGRVLVDVDWIKVLSSAPVGHPALDERLAAVTRRGGMSVAEWMTVFPGGYVSAYFDRLHAAGLLIEEQVRLLGLVKRPGYRLADPSRFHAIASRVHAAVTGAGEQPPQATALAGLLYVAGMGSWFYPGPQNKALRERLAQFAGKGRSDASQPVGNQVDPNLLFPHNPGDASAVHDAVPQAGGMREHGIPRDQSQGFGQGADPGWHESGPSPSPDPNAAAAAAASSSYQAASEAAHAVAHAAAQAATHAAAHAAVNASVQAATHAATHFHPSPGSSSGDSSPSHHHH
jgi:hypothetical protein